MTTDGPIRGATARCQRDLRLGPSRCLAPSMARHGHVSLRELVTMGYALLVDSEPSKRQSGAPPSATSRDHERQPWAPQLPPCAPVSFALRSVAQMTPSSPQKEHTVVRLHLVHENGTQGTVVEGAMCGG